MNLIKDDIERAVDFEELKQANDVKAVTARPDYEGLNANQDLDSNDFTEELTEERSNETTKVTTQPPTTKAKLTTTKQSEVDFLWTDEKFESLLNQGCKKLLELYEVKD